jgi:hypothetical protein
VFSVSRYIHSPRMMTGQNCKNLSQDSWYLRSDSNCVLYKYKYAVLPRHQLARFLCMSLFKIHSVEDSCQHELLGWKNDAFVCQCL